MQSMPAGKAADAAEDTRQSGSAHTLTHRDSFLHINPSIVLVADATTQKMVRWVQSYAANGCGVSELKQ